MCYRRFADAKGKAIILEFSSFSSFCIIEPRSDKRGLLAIKVKLRYLQKKKDLAVVNKYRKFEDIILTNNKDMSV